MLSESHRSAFRNALELLDDVQIIKPLPPSDILFQFSKAKVAQILRCYLFISIPVVLESLNKLLVCDLCVCVA